MLMKCAERTTTCSVHQKKNGFQEVDYYCVCAEKKFHYYRNA